MMDITFDLLLEFEVQQFFWEGKFSSFQCLKNPYANMTKKWKGFDFLIFQIPLILTRFSLFDDKVSSSWWFFRLIWIKIEDRLNRWREACNVGWVKKLTGKRGESQLGGENQEISLPMEAFYMKVACASVSECVLGSVSIFGTGRGLNHYFFESDLVPLYPVLFLCLFLLTQLIPFISPCYVSFIFLWQQLLLVCFSFFFFSPF